MNTHLQLTEKERPIYMNEGFQYIKDRKLINNIMSWRCIHHKCKKCNARIHVGVDGLIIKSISVHNHIPELNKIQALNIYNEMKLLAKNSEMNPGNIIAEKCDNINEKNVEYFPKIDNIKRTLRNKRSIELGVGSPPNKLYNIQIDNKIFKVNEVSIVLFDSGIQEMDKRIIIFTRPQDIKYLKKCEHVFIDGSFYSAPKIAYQLFTIHIFIENTVLPLIYCILPSKKQNAYEVMLNGIKNKIPDFYPKSIMMDFEMSLFLSCKRVFPNSNLKGCFFHFSQAIIRKVNEKYKIIHTNDKQFKSVIKKLILLAIIEKSKIMESFLNIKEFLPLDILLYFQTTYLGIYVENEISINPLFPIDFWNINDRFVQLLPRTNNYVEGWHSHFNKFIGSAHPNFYKLTLKIKKQMNLVGFKLLQLKKYK